MSKLNDGWNPDDGPPPTDREIAEARALAGALETRAANGTEPDVADLVSVARRLQATARPDPAAAREVALRAVDHAVAWSSSPFRLRRGRWGVMAACAVAVLCVGVGIGGRAVSPRHAPPSESISRPATDVFREPVAPGAGSMPSDSIYSSRLHDYRAVLLVGGRL